MSFRVILLLLLGLSLQRGDFFPIAQSNQNYIARLNGSASLQNELVDECTSYTIAGSPIGLESIIRAIINGDWDRVQLVIQMANEACTLEMKHTIYETLWREWQQDKQIYDPLKILALFEQLEHQPNVPPALLRTVYVTFVARSAQFLSTPLHTDSRSAKFPLVTTLLQRLTRDTQNYMRDILETLFDDVLSLESTLAVAQRLPNLNGTITQLTMANLQLLNRPEVQFNSSAYAALLENLRQLVSKPMFELEVKASLIPELNKHVQTNIGILYTARKVCLRKANNGNDYLYECPEAMNMCTRTRNDKMMLFEVQRKINDTNKETQFAFKSPYRGRSLVVDPSITVQAGVTRNLYSKGSIYWWHVKPVRNGVAISDAATSSMVICGGDSTYWDREHFAYSRPARDFDAHREDCTWIVEDCSNL